MDVGALWAAAEMTSKICNVIQYLRGEMNYTREEAANDLVKVLDEHLEPMFNAAFLENPEPRNNEYLAIEDERRHKTIDRDNGCQDV